jgi:hypothetical protein
MNFFLGSLGFLFSFCPFKKIPKVGWRMALRPKLKYCTMNTGTVALSRLPVPVWLFSSGSKKSEKLQKAEKKMFPTDRFNSLLPNAEKLHEDLKDAADLEYTPKTSKEFGSTMVLHQFLPAWEVQAYIRFADLRLHIHNAKYPLFEAMGTKISIQKQKKTRSVL